MIEEVVSLELAVDEKLVIRKNRYTPQVSTGREKRISIVSGIHGDELEGQYVCYELNRILKEQPEHIKGIIDIYPVINPMGMDTITRGVPMFDLDMNRIFPGNTQGPLPETVAAKVVDDLIGSDICIDVHSSDIFLSEILQVRMDESMSEGLLPYAKKLNVDFIWVHQSPTVLDATLVHSLNMLGVPALAIEMGSGMKVTRSYGRQLIVGIFGVMKELGIWTGETEEVREPIISEGKEVILMHASTSGIFLPALHHGSFIEANQQFGSIVDPLTGEIKETIFAKQSGLVFTTREYPVVYEGSLVGRIVGGVK